MSDSNFNSADVLMNRGLNGYGYGGGRSGGYGNGHGNLPGDGSAVNANVVANRDIGLTSQIASNAAAISLSDQISAANTAGQSSQDRSDRFLASQMNSQHDTLSRQISDNRVEDRFNAIAAAASAAHIATLAEISRNNLASVERDADTKTLIAKCCCEQEKAHAAIIANQENHRLATAESENQALRTQILINNQGRVGGGGQGNG
jgi:hypothetical protein